METNLNRKDDEYEKEVYEHRLRRMALDPNRPRREIGVQTEPVGKKWLIRHRERASHEARKNPRFLVENFDKDYPPYQFSESEPEVRLDLTLRKT